ncbi:MAG: hypothetical protein V4681_03785 [Patescibacteria group bacterium]
MKKIPLILLAILLVPAQVVAMTTPILTYNPQSGSLSTTAVRFIPLGPSGNVGSPGASALNHTMPTAGTFSKLYVRMPAALSAGTSYTIVLMKNGVASALSVQITDAGLTAQDTSNTVTVAAGDTVGFRITPSGTPVSQTGNYQVGVVFDSTVSGESLIFSRGVGSNTTGNSYFTLGGGGSISVGASTYATVFPTNGVIDKMYVTSGAPGAGISRTVALTVNGVDSTLTCTMSDAAGSCNDVTHAVSISAGDEVVVHESVTGTVTSTNIHTSMRFVPTIPGESVMMGVGGNPNNAADRYQHTHGYILNASSEAITQAVAPIAFTWKKLYLDYDTAPGAGNSRSFTARIGGVSQSLTANVTDTNTTANNTSNQVAVAVGDLINWVTTPVSAPTAPARMAVGAVMYIAPPDPSAPVGQARFLNLGTMLLNMGKLIIQ